MKDLISPKITLVESFSDVEKLFTWLGEKREVLGFDTETTGLSIVKDRIRLVQFGDERQSFCMQWDRWSGVAQEIFNKYEGDFVGHNSKYDVCMLEMDGIKVPRERVHDTMIMSRLINWNVFSHGLKDLTRYHLDPRLTGGEDALKKVFKENKWDWDTVPINNKAYWVYAGLDTSITAALYSQYKKRIIEEGFEDVYNMEMESLMVAADMEQHGVRVDLDYCQQKYDELTKYCDEVVDYCQKEYKLKPGSSDAVTKVLIADGVPLYEKTATGKWKFTKDQIEEFKDAHPLVTLIHDYKDAVKLSSNYFLNILNEQHNGRIHCNINTLQAITGRMSVTKPALQTLPRGRVVRDAFIPDEGEKWCSIDFSNVELRIAASIAQESTMIDLFNSGEDLHGYLAEQVFKTKDYSKEQRQIAKNANFTKIYGGGVKKFAGTAGISEDDAQKVYDAYNESFPAMKLFSRKLINESINNRERDGFTWVRNESGRRHVVDIDYEYKLVNFMIQSEAAEVLKKALIRIKSAGLGQYCILPVHDEILFSLPEDEAEELRDQAVNLMQDLDSYAVPLLVEASPLTDSWGAAK